MIIATAKTIAIAATIGRTPRRGRRRSSTAIVPQAAVEVPTRMMATGEWRGVTATSSAEDKTAVTNIPTPTRAEPASQSQARL